MDNNNNSFGALLEESESAYRRELEEQFEDVTEELAELDDSDTEDDTEDEEVLREILESVPLILEDVARWIHEMTRYERLHWDQWVRELNTYENALVSLGFTHQDVQDYLAQNEP